MFFLRKKNKKIINPIIERKSRIRPRNASWSAEKIFVGIMAISFLGVTVYVLFFSNFLAIKKIDIQDTGRINPEEVKGRVYQMLSGKYLSFLPKNNIILVQKNAISQDLIGDFKLIKSLKIEKDFPNSLAILIMEKNPMLLLRSNGKDYVIDEKGIAYDRSDFESDFLNENSLLILEDKSGKNVKEKEEAIDPGYLDFILSVREDLSRNLDISIRQLITAPNLISGDLSVETNEGWKIFFNKEVGLVKEIEMLKAVLGGKIEKEKRQELEYIDLRTDNKVYYKFKNTEQKDGN
jgi:cell division septal protein FtsQ